MCEEPGTVEADAGAVMSGILPDDEEAVAGDYFDHELIKREMEAQIIDYISKNEDMLTIIQHGQRLKAHIRQARGTKGTAAPEIQGQSARAFVR